MSARLILPAILATVFHTATSTAAAPPARPASREVITALLTRLGSNSFAEREAASKRLECMEEAIPALREALRSPDLEVRVRAGRILRKLLAAQAERALQRLLARVKAGEVDSFVEQLAGAKDKAKDEHWQAALALAETVMKASGVIAGRVSVPGRELMKQPGRTASDRRGAMVVNERLIADNVDITAHVVEGAVLCNGLVRTGSHVVGGIVFANGPVKIGSHVVGGLIICDADVEIGSHVVDSVIIARGKVKVGSFTRNSLIKQGKSEPLAGVKFFSTQILGGELEGGEERVTLGMLRPGSPLARAGLRKGDVVQAVNGEKVDSPLSGRRALRRGVLAGQPMTVRLRRGERDLEVKVRPGVKAKDLP